MLPNLMKFGKKNEGTASVFQIQDGDSRHVGFFPPGVF